MKLEQGYGTLQEDVRLGGFDKDKNPEWGNFEKGQSFYVVVEQKNNTISSGIREEKTGFTTRVVGNVFTNQSGVRITK